MRFVYDVCVVGGCGHVGLPLSITLAASGKKVCIFDINDESLQLVSTGRMPFKEQDAEPLLQQALRDGTLTLSNSPESISQSESVVLIIGTPVDEFLNPRLRDIKRTIDNYIPYFVAGQLLVLRSTLFPGTTAFVVKALSRRGIPIDVAFCPERVAEGHAIRELRELPQIVSSFTASGFERAATLFRSLTDEIVELRPAEAELAKLFTNAWRYLKFSVANQFYMIANDQGLDYYAIHHALTYKYPRAKDLPTAGFAAGPCLLKDTMQLAAHYGNNFYLGQAAMLVNEGLPGYIVRSIQKTTNLADLTVGILGMAFKAESDDTRSSLSYKLRKILEMECADVLCTDPYVVAPDFVSAEELVRRSDLLIVGAPHHRYRDLDIAGKPVVDIWNLYDRGGLL